MKYERSDIFTVPNAVTFGRLVLSPYMAKRLERDPKNNWLKACLFVSSDILDGFMAKSGEEIPWLKAVGFRKSELGRLLDPVIDKPTTVQLLRAGWRNGVLPKPLTAVAISQKVAISAHALYQAHNGIEQQVSQLGRRTELLSNLGFGSLFAAESIEDERLKQHAREVATAVAVVGVAGAIIADVGYLRAAKQQNILQ